ncbi:MAG: hypothetical protein LBO82_10395 [Synergistaceae bacterium]|jgi:hypothetical protein|nr:hypothetical protein [Synergistaceae bacterium]
MGRYPHYKDIDQRLAAIIAINTALGTDLGFLKDIRKSMESTLETETAMDVWEEAQYQLDHGVLDDVVWRDISGDIKELYDGLSSMQVAAFSFMNPAAAALSFSQQYPGYRKHQSGTYIDFAQAYKTRVDGNLILGGGLQGYLKGVLKANNSEFLAVQKAQEQIKKLKDASDNAGYYRQMWQAGDQIVNVVNQEISQLRIDIQRQLDAELRYALNEQQERADGQAAFEWAVQEWQTQSSGKGY